MAKIEFNGKTKGLLVLVIILAVLLVLLFVTDKPKEEPGNRARPLFSLKTDRLEKITIEQPGNTVMQLEQADGKWRLAEPVEARADADAVKSVTKLAGSLLGFPMEHDASDNLAEFGLTGDGRTRFVASDTQGNTEELILGDTIPLDVGYVYGYLPDKNELYKVQKDAKEAFNRPLFEFRDKRVTELTPEKITGVEILQKSGVGDSKLVLKREGKWWNIAEPQKIPAEINEVNKLIKSVTDLQAVKFPRDIAPDKVSSSAELQIKLSSDKGGDVNLFFAGTYSGDKDTELVRNAGLNYTFAVPAGIVGQLPLTLDTLRSKAPLRFAPTDITAIQVRRNGESFKLEIKNGDWHFADSDSIPVDTTKVSEVFQLLTQTEVVDSPAAGAGGVKENSDSGTHVLLTGKDGREYTLWLSPADPKAKQITGTSSFREKPFTFEASMLEGAPLSKADFIDTHLLIFNPTKVGLIEMQIGKKLVRIEKNGNNWLMLKPERIATNEPKVWGILFALEAMTYEKTVTDEAPFKADDTAVITLKDLDDNLIGSVTLAGIKDPDTLYVKSSIRKGIFTVDRSVLKKIPLDYTTLMYKR